MNFKPSREFATQQLEKFINKNLVEYSRLRNFDFGPNNRSNISCLSPYVTHGIISELEILNKCLKKFSFLKVKNLFKRYFGEYIGKVGWS